MGNNFLSSRLSVYIMGYQWNADENLWSADIAYVEKLAAAEILKHTPTSPAEEKGSLKADKKSSISTTLEFKVKSSLKCRSLFALPSSMLHGIMLYFGKLTCSTRQ
jgi:hypothetical protein